MSRRTLFTSLFWLDALERAVKTAVQAVLMAITLSDTTNVNLFELDLKVIGQFALSGAVFSILTSIVSAPIGTAGTASVVPTPPMPPPPPPEE